jgi:hypothetical protein
MIEPQLGRDGEGRATLPVIIVPLRPTYYAYNILKNGEITRM